jgi:hypothetical protein
MAHRIASGSKDCRLSILGKAEKAVRMRRRLNGLNGDLHVARRAILESHRARQTRNQLSMHLALGRSRPDIAPQLTKPAKYSGMIIFRNSVPAGTSISAKSRSKCRANLRPSAKGIFKCIHVSVRVDYFSGLR